MAATTTDYVQFAEGAALGHQFRLRSRTHPALHFPVPLFQALSDTQPIALDLQPKGANPYHSAGNGYTWFDACDADLELNRNAPVNCARLSIMVVDGVASACFGHVGFNGATAANAYVMTGGIPRWGASFDVGNWFPYVDNAVSLGLPDRRITDVFLTGVGSLQGRLADYEARITELETALTAQTALNATFESRIYALEHP